VANTERRDAAAWLACNSSGFSACGGFCARPYNFFNNPTTLRQDTHNIMADTAAAAPAQYKQPSRKGKKAWRKNVDVTQIQSGLEDVRDQIISG
jgi:hypothetical protein